ncbi:MAG: hypothetical protein ACLQSR_07155 [Limisphaerales bacterium]
MINRSQRVSLPFRKAGRKLLIGALIFATLAVAAGLWSVRPIPLQWPDRRPIGELFLASGYHSSPANPRGWFNDQSLNVIGTNGPEQFRQALFKYTDQSIAVLKKTGAQGVIVWDLEGEQYPHKTTFIGDPRLVQRLAPEMDPVADEFFRRLRDAGLRVGVTIRPQQLVFGDNGPRQTTVFDIKRVLLEKIDYARKRWGATLFYVDSNDGLWRPDELWQLRRVAAERPDILLIPEHSDALYRGFCAPYVSVRNNGLPATSTLVQKLFPHSFEVLNLGDATNDPAAIAGAMEKGDVLLFRAWYWNSDCDLLERVEQAGK